MALQQWSNSLACGVKVIDQDHQGLFAMVALIHKADQENKPESEIAAAIDGLVLYVREHFEREERFMKRAGYPDFRAHRKQHKEFRRTIRALAKLYRMEPKVIDVKKLSLFLERWLIDHISIKDMDWVPFVKGEKNGNPEIRDEVSDINVDIDHQIYVCPKKKAKLVRDFIQLLDEDDDYAKTIETALNEILLIKENGQIDQVRKLFGKAVA